MNPPSNTELFETPVATFWYGEDGILYSSGKNVRRTLENLGENFRILKQITNNQKRCVISFMNSSGTYTDKTTREFLEQELAKSCKAIAFVSDSLVGAMNGNILVVVGTELPKHFFNNVEDAREWLKPYM